MKVCPLNFDLFKFFVGHMDSLRVGVGIEFGFNLQPRPGGRACDQIHHDLMAEQGLSPPIHAEVAEHPMLDLVQMCIRDSS